MRALLALAAFLVAALGSAAHGSTTDAPAEDDYGAAAAGCDVTEAVEVPPTTPGAIDSSWQIQGDGLAFYMGERSTFAVPPRGERLAPGTQSARWRRGMIAGKVGWTREPQARGLLRVKARSLPGGDKAIAEYRDFRRSEVIPGYMAFPHEGCWRVVGRSGDNTLRATIWVVALRERPD